MGSLPPACCTLSGLGVQRAQGAYPACSEAPAGPWVMGSGRPQGGRSQPGLRLPARRVARPQGQGPGRTPMHGCVQRAPTGPRAPAGSLGWVLPSSILPYLEGPGPESPPGQGGFPCQFVFSGGSPCPRLRSLAPQSKAPGEPYIKAQRVQVAVLVARPSGRSGTLGHLVTPLASQCLWASWGSENPGHRVEQGVPYVEAQRDLMAVLVVRPSGRSDTRGIWLCSRSPYGTSR
ncbi:hypothetical protein NDU88_011903 [Pleurodeles waltl]|uniref:Uncharacterized protein n=1 Tax=Pleurodeles waltl TaxID=8319 RepID=A0AAV7QYM9_PLEWA|nr:hypothetical protein NDU88_011903 [Pleurodeles waltl]